VIRDTSILPRHERRHEPRWRTPGRGHSWISTRPHIGFGPALTVAFTGEHISPGRSIGLLAPAARRTVTAACVHAAAAVLAVAALPAEGWATFAEHRILR
jgi:ABC-type nitrate/sulfonate/bicarbonate transport system permease component